MQRGAGIKQLNGNEFNGHQKHEGSNAGKSRAASPGLWCCSVICSETQTVAVPALPLTRSAQSPQ